MKERIYGGLEFVDGREVAGWALDIGDPSRRLKVQIRVGNALIGATETELPRADVELAHGITGQFGFSFYASHTLSDEEIDDVAVYLPEYDVLLGSANAIRVRHSTESHPGGDLRINVDNLGEVRRSTPRSYEWVRLDPVMNCNVQCVYCHNHRTNARFEFDEMARILDDKVVSAENFQVGCTMEPTMDRRLAEIFEMIAKSPAKPSKAFKLATNGSLLHRHDAGRLVAAGLNNITVSIDTLDPAVMSKLRGGLDLQQIVDNVTTMVRTFPEIEITFTAAVSRLTVSHLVEFVGWSIDLGVRDFIFHEIYYYPMNDRVAERTMADLMLNDGEFYRAKREVMTRFGRQARMHFAHDAFMRRMMDEYVPRPWVSVSRNDQIPLVRSGSLARLQ